ncbi:hypothetical protein FPOA_03338 [Fusarium poae]|uniref:2EXR domain-containing protein n=1 Tax=Fusarium poae TaxID=36050 RepID=A0A1B8B9K9_FUSPO|nr:hypothetical protein FPOA_03338 [Fusarium poae]
MTSQEQQLAPHPPPPPFPFCPPAPLRFSLNRLPPELRNHIWTLTLPCCRIFMVKRIERQNHKSQEGFFNFHHSNPNPRFPIALSVCRESREAALRQGFFFQEGKESAGLWFRPDTDILYFSTKQKWILRTKKHISIPEWDRVLHVGIQLEAFYFHKDFLSTPPENLAKKMERFYAHMPNLKTLSCMVWGRQGSRRIAVTFPMALPGSDEDTYALMRGRNIREVNDLVFNLTMSGNMGDV